MQTDAYSFNAGALCLNFANTVDWHASDRPQELLHGYAGLITWAEAATILTDDHAGSLRELAGEQPKAAEAAFQRAINLREAIYRIFIDVSEQEDLSAADLALLNETLRESLSHLQIVHSAAGFDWGWVESPPDFDQILWPIARSAANLLISDKLTRVRQCADDRGCGYLFIDTSRNRSRRWCSMESCGNRAKAQRHYRRRQKAP